ncbi:MAG: hypothetical protein ABI411_15890 [Tahibacter sp.]
MWIIGLILLILLGLAGIAALIRARSPAVAGPLMQLEAVEGWLGVAGLVWGLVMLLQWISSLGLFGYAPGMMLVALFSILVMLSLSLILAMPLLKTLIGANPFTTKMSELSAQLTPFKAILGIICLVLALWTIVQRVM